MIQNLKRVNIFATTFYGSIFKIGAHHIYTELRKLSLTVTYISAPNSIFNLLNIKYLDTRRRNLEAIKYLFGIFGDDRSIIPINFCPYRILRRYLSIELSIRFSKPFVRVKYDKQADLSIIDSVDLLFLVPELLSLKQKIIYRPTDINFHASKYNLELEERFVKQNNIKIFCMSEHSYNFYKSNGFNVVGHEKNGIPKDWIDEYQGYNLLTNLKLVYVGALDARIDYELIRRLSEDDDLELAIYGAGPYVDRIKSINPKLYKGIVSYSELRNVLSGHNVGILPFNDNRLNLSRSPMKFHEYLSAGLYVLNTRQLGQMLEITGENGKKFFVKNNSQSEGQVLKELQARTWEIVTHKILQNS